MFLINHNMRKVLFLIALMTAGANAFTQVNGGLVAKYSFNQHNANDDLGLHNGIVYGARLTQDRFGNENAAYQFDSDSLQYIEVPYHPDFTPGTHPMSISVWFLSGQNVLRSASTYNSVECIIDWYRCGANPLCMEGFDGAFYNISLVDSGKVYFDVRGDPGMLDTNFYSSQYYNDGGWHHAVLIFDPTVNFQEYYIDNVRVDSVPASLNSLTDGGFQIPFSIGRHFRTGWGVPGYYYRGKIDDIRVYNRTLSAREVDSLFNETYSISGLPSPHYSFMSVFPNPFGNFLTIQTNSVSPVQFKLYSSEGKLLIGKVLNKKITSLDMSSVTPNIYFYQMVSDGNIIKSGKLIKK
jgi:hypothetical protein